MREFVHFGRLSILIILCLSSSVFAYSGGNGIANNDCDTDTDKPYQIATVADFQQLSATPTDWGKAFILIADIDLTGLTFTKSPIAPDTSTSSGFQGTQFTGMFNGNGHIISNLTITTSTKDYIGLFGNVGTDGQIYNLGLKNVHINGPFYVGGLAGKNTGTLTSCYVTGLITGTSSYVGGLVGYNKDGELTFCYATGSVSGIEEVGGLVGSNKYGTLTACYATGLVNGTSDVGGLVGVNNYGTLTSCYATGSVSGTDAEVGGLVGGNNYGTLTSCYATTSVTGTSKVGGLVGVNYQSKVIRCYSTGKPSGTSNIGGLCGIVVTGGSYEDTGNFWDTETSQKTTSAMGTGKTTAEMKILSTFTDAGWDFSATYGDPADWQMPKNKYPHLKWENCVVKIDLSGEYWFGSMSVNTSTNVPWAKKGTLSVIGNNWVQEWDDQSGHHTFSATFTTSLQPDGSIILNFPSGPYNVAWNGDVMIHAGSALGNSGQGNYLIDIFTRKAVNVTAADLIGQYGFCDYRLPTGDDRISWGDIIYNANGTAPYSLENNDSSTSSGTMNWVLDAANAKANITGGQTPALLCKGGIVFTPYYASGLYGYNFSVKKTTQTITYAEMAGTYQVRFLETGPDGVPYTCSQGICVLGSNGSLSLDAYYSDGEHDEIFIEEYTIIGNFIYIPDRSVPLGIISPNKDLIFIPEYRYEDPPTREYCDWLGGIFLIREQQFDITDLNKDGGIDAADLKILTSHWLENAGAAGGDIYNDNIVNFRDFAILISHWTSTVPLRLAADINGDSFVNFQDFAVLAKWWFDDCDAGSDWCNDTDIDRSGDVDIFDLEKLANHWLE